MFRTIKTPLLGMVQNMSSFTCPHCHTTTNVFGAHGVEKKCAELGIELLADIPLHAKICDDADRGKPTIVSEPQSDRAKAFMGLAEKVGGLVGL